MRHLKLFLFFLCIYIVTNKCSDQTNCFVKKLFDFNYPSQDIYPISLDGTTTNPTPITIKAYGDFNNDLRSDYISVDIYSNSLIYIYSTSTNLYQLASNISTFQNCNPINYYLYDANDDGSLDITIWGINTGDGTNCMYSMLQNNQGGFGVAVGNTQNFTITTQPSLFQYNLPAGGGSIKTNCLLIYNQGINLRQAYYLSSGKYQVLNQTSLLTNLNYASIPFSDQHWNTFIDITNDCFPDFIVTNNLNEIEFWIYNSGLNVFIYSYSYNPTSAITSLNIIDLNYDGSLDLIIAQSDQFMVYLGSNPLTIDSQFCVSESYNFNFNWQSPIIYTLSTGQSLIQQNFQFADININGYPQLMFLILKQNGEIYISVLENQFQTGGTFGTFSLYQDKLNSKLSSMKIISISFFDILDNGIIDIIVNINEGMQAFYNNYLYQNSFYIKGYGTDGKQTNRGAQVAGISFYWVNSVGNTQRVSYCSQISQTSYNSLPMPYALTGLGRANNYVEMFTVGRLGQKKSWSPIIPNSQLAIFTGSQPSSGWNIKIFIMPADSLVYVVIVCIVILALLGLILAAIKCHKKKDQATPLLPDI